MSRLDALIVAQLDASTRKAFFRARLQLAKLAVTGSCTNDIIARTFGDILGRHPREGGASAA
jgi:hypothetical protein